MVQINLEELLKLPPADRAELAVALWDSLTESPEAQARVPLPPEHVAELERRLAEHEADPTSAIPWEEVRRQLRQQP